MSSHALVRHVEPVPDVPVRPRVMFVITVAEVKPDSGVPNCSRCFADEAWVRSRIRWYERGKQLLSRNRPFRCKRCGCRTWLTAARRRTRRASEKA